MSLNLPQRTPPSPAKRAALLKELRAFLPADSVLEQEEELRPYECDGLSAYRQLPLLVVLPRTVEEVQRIMRLCRAREVPVVARGAGTGLSGGALPLADGVLLSLARFNRILGIDPINRTARVQPGVRNLAISEAAGIHGLYYAPDPCSQIACTIGGNVAENSGGVHCLKYGLTVHNVLAVTCRDHRRGPGRAGRRGPGRPRLRSAGPLHRLRGDARRDGGGHGTTAADPRAGPGRTRGLR